MGRIKKAVKKAAAAVRQAVQQFTAWSYSRYKDHRTCPRMAHWKHILKKPQGPKSPAMQRGGDIHKEGEHYVGGADMQGFSNVPKERRKLYAKKGVRWFLKEVPASFKAFKKEMEALRKGKAVAEGRWAMSVAWKPVEFFDMARAWCRVILDARMEVGRKKVRVIDFKTGKVYPDDNEEQMELYAVSGFEHYPEADEIDVELWYLDQMRGPLPGFAPAISNPIVKTYKRAQLPSLERKWRGKVIPILTDKRFVPNPGRNCGWCDYSQRKGGECQY